MDFVNETCPRCGIVFKVTQSFQDIIKKDKRNFYCPSGHSAVYGGPTEEKRLNNLLIERNLEIDRLENALKEKCKPKRKYNKKTK